MLKFKNYLTESKGADTAFSGHANEHFTNALLNQYVEHLGKHLKKGVDYDTAHEKALDHINSRKYTDKAQGNYSYDNLPQLENARNHMGDEEMQNMHDDAKKSAIAVANHIKNNYGHVVTGSEHVGGANGGGVAAGGGGADLLVHTKNQQGQPDTAKAIMDHVGASLKYSKKSASSIKIHSPTIGNMAAIIDAHHEAMHGHSTSLNDTLHSIANEGVENQRKSLAPHHAFLTNYFASHNNPKMKYEPITDKRGKIIGGNLNKEAISHLRDQSKGSKHRDIYNDMAAENLKMKNKMAATIHDSISSVLDQPYTGTKLDPKHAKIKESLLRSMANIHKGQLPTFLVSTERKKPTASVYDTGQFLTNNMATDGVDRHGYSGKSTLRAGPLNMSLDTRPTTSRNPVSSYPINVNMKASDIKKQKDPTASPTIAKPIKKPNMSVPAGTGEHGGVSFESPADKAQARSMRGK